MKIQKLLIATFLPIFFFIILGMLVFYYPQIGKIGNTFHRIQFSDPEFSKGATSAFEIYEFQGKAYALYSSPDKRKPFIISINDDKKIDLTGVVEGEQIYGAFNDKDNSLTIVTSLNENGILRGAIYRTLDMIHFDRVHISEGFGYRSVINYKGNFVAGTDASDGRIYVSANGINWHEVRPPTDTMPIECNKLVVFKGGLYFASNSGLIVTHDLKSFNRVFLPTQKGFQVNATLATEKTIFVGVGGPSLGKDTSGWIFSSEDGLNFKQNVTMKGIVFLSSIFATNYKDEEIWVTGNGGTIFKLDVRNGRYSPLYETPEEYFYTSKKIGSSIYFGTRSGNLYRYGPHALHSNDHYFSKKRSNV
jgi:hypothetical protein